MNQKPVITPSINSRADSLAIVSMVLGATSLLGPGLILGIPAIITAIIALKKGTKERGLSIAGLVTGSISTLFSLLLTAVIALVIALSLSHPQPSWQLPPQEEPQLFNSTKT